MSKLAEGPMYVTDCEGIPWSSHNVHIHLRYSPRLKETTLTLFTKDHQKILKLTNKEYDELPSDYLRNNWALECKRKWQKELMALYQGMGD